MSETPGTLGGDGMERGDPAFDEDPKGTDSDRRSADGGSRGEAVDPVLTVDAEAEQERIAEFLRTSVDAADAEGVVVNMSGGLDSTVTAALAVEALGPDRVHGLALPSNKTGDANARDAEALAGALGIDLDTVHLQPLVAAFGSAVPERFDLHGDPISTGNLVARLRMAVAYLAANATDRLVLGTTNRSERLLGYYTKHGDGAADLLPLGHLYKTQVRTLAEALDVPRFVLDRPATAGFLLGQDDRNELGAPYEVVDPVLRLAVDEGVGGETVAARLGVEEGTVADLLARHETSRHKRARPPAPTDSR